MFKDKKTKDAAIAALTGLVLSWAINRRLDWRDAVRTLRQIADDIEANNQQPGG